MPHINTPPSNLLPTDEYQGLHHLYGDMNSFIVNMRILYESGYYRILWYNLQSQCNHRAARQACLVHG